MSTNPDLNLYSLAFLKPNPRHEILRERVALVRIPLTVWFHWSCT